MSVESLAMHQVRKIPKQRSCSLDGKKDMETHDSGKPVSCFQSSDICEACLWSEGENSASFLHSVSIEIW